MGDSTTVKEEVEEQIKEVVYSPTSRIHDGGSSCATLEALPLPVHGPAPPHLSSYVLRQEPWPSRFFWPPPGHFLARVLWQGPLMWNMSMRTFGCLLAFVPWQGPLPWHFFRPAPGRFLPFVPWQGPLLWNSFIRAPRHLLACVPWQGPWLLHVPMAAPAHFLAHFLACGPRQEPLPLCAPMLPPAHILACVQVRAARCKFMVDVKATGKQLLLSSLLHDWVMTGSYLDLVARVEELFQDHPDLLETFNKFLPENHRCILPESARERIVQELLTDS